MDDMDVICVVISRFFYIYKIQMGLSRHARQVCVHVLEEDIHTSIHRRAKFNIIMLLHRTAYRDRVAI